MKKTKLLLILLITILAGCNTQKDSNLPSTTEISLTVTSGDIQNITGKTNDTLSDDNNTGSDINNTLSDNNDTLSDINNTGSQTTTNLQDNNTTSQISSGNNKTTNTVAGNTQDNITKQNIQKLIDKRKTTMSGEKKLTEEDIQLIEDVLKEISNQTK